jgi:hypothetical protein
VRHIKVGAIRRTADLAGERLAVFLRQRPSERGAERRVLPQFQDRLARRGIADGKGAIRAGRDRVGIVGQAELAALAFHKPEPGLLDELEQSRS